MSNRAEELEEMSDELDSSYKENSKLKAELGTVKKKLLGIHNIIDLVWDENITCKQAMFALDQIGEICDPDSTN